MIRLTIPSIEEEDLQAVREVLVSGFLVQGKHVAALEQTIADYVGTKYAVAVSNCTAALHLSLLVLDTRPGDLVIVTAYSFIATANVIELCGAQPVFVDIEPDTFNLDPNRLEETLTRLTKNVATARRLKAIIPVHTFGQLADMPAIMQLADRYKLPVIEDAACALGGTIHRRHAGTWGLMGCFSFHPRKVITTGEGGIVTTNSAETMKLLKTLRNHGQDPDATLANFVRPGFNYRMTEFQAALGLSQAKRLDTLLEARRKLATTYNTLFEGTDFQTPKIRPGSTVTYQSYVVLLPEETAKRRSQIIDSLRLHGIETTIGTWSIPNTLYYRNTYGYKQADFPVANWVFDRSIALPIYDRLPENDQEKIVSMLKACVTG
jgi:dTDP-4-amino-4,6-dideoxygalactose transaminase